MRKVKAYNTLMLLSILAIVAVVWASHGNALWGDATKGSKLEKDSYERLVKKNLELRDEVDKLVKEQEQLRGIYKILLEKVKTLQRDNTSANQKVDELSKELEEARKTLPKTLPKKNEKAAKEAIAEPYTEPDPNTPDERAKGLLEDISVNKEIVENQAEKIRQQEERISALEKELGRLEGIFDTTVLKKRYPDAFARKSEAEKFRKSAAASRVREEVDKLSAKQKVKAEQVSALDKEIEASRINEKELKGKVESAGKHIAQLKESVASINAEVKSESEGALSEQDRIKALESSLDKAIVLQRDSEAKLQETVNKVNQIEEAVRKTSANPAPKGNPAGSKSEEVKSLEKDLEKARGEERDSREQAEEAQSKVEDLRSAIDETRAKVEEGTARAASGKEKIKTMEKEIADGQAQGDVFKKDLQRLMKKTAGLKEKRAALSADIEAEEKKIRDLKKIIEKRMVEINNAPGSQSARTEAGLAGEAEGVLSMLNSEIRNLKAKNEELEASLKNAERGDKKPWRKNDLPPDVKRKLDKERLDMHYNLAVVYDKNRMYKDAEREYLKCLKIDPNDADVIYNLGILYDDKLNNDHKAANYYKKYLAIRPMGENATQVRVWLTGIELEQRIGKEMR